MNTIYIFHSHDLRLVELQVSRIRAHCKDDHELVIVQGPFGANGMTSAGCCRIPNKSVGKQLGVTVIDAPAIFAGLTMPIRFHRICDWVWMEHASKEDGKVLFMHGDNIPKADFNFADLLDGKPVGGRSVKRDDGQHGVPITWLAFDLSKFKSLHGFTDYMHDKAGQWMGHEMHCVEQRKIQVTDKWYYEEDRWFTHLDKLSTMWTFHNHFDAKLDHFELDEYRKQPDWLDTLRNQRKHDPSTNPSLNPCTHRGEELREEECPSCGGQVSVKVFSCTVHDECTIKTPMGPKVCITCPDRDV